MRRYIPALVTAALALGAPITAAGPASAFGGETLGCQVSPGGYNLNTPNCGTSWPASRYEVSYDVLGGSGTYTYSWSAVPVPAGSITAGCTSSTYYCSFTIPETASDRYLTETVVISQAGSQATLSATAYIPAGCGSQLC